MKRKNDAAFNRSCMEKGPKSTMEMMLLNEYLDRHGQSLATLDALPKEKADVLLAAACQYAALKMAEIESKAGIRRTIHLAG